MNLTDEMSETMARMLEAYSADAELVRRVRRREPVTLGEVKAALHMTGPELAAEFAMAHWLRTGQRLEPLNKSQRDSEPHQIH